MQIGLAKKGTEKKEEQKLPVETDVVNTPKDGDAPLIALKDLPEPDSSTFSSETAAPQEKEAIPVKNKSFNSLILFLTVGIVILMALLIVFRKKILVILCRNQNYKKN